MPSVLKLHQLIDPAEKNTLLNVKHRVCVCVCCVCVCVCCVCVCCRACVCVCVFRVEMAVSAILSLRPASLVVKQSSRAHLWPTLLSVCVCVCVCVWVLWGCRIKWCLCSSAGFVLWEVNSAYPSCDSLFVPLASCSQHRNNDIVFVCVRVCVRVCVCL